LPSTLSLHTGGRAEGRRTGYYRTTRYEDAEPNCLTIRGNSEGALYRFSVNDTSSYSNSNPCNNPRQHYLHVCNLKNIYAGHKDIYAMRGSNWEKIRKKGAQRGINRDFRLARDLIM
jgi:hypothetical protein